MSVTQVGYTNDEVARCGDAIYDRDIRSQVENEQNKGKFVLIDVKSGEWEMDTDEIAASRRIRDRLPDSQVWIVRVGYPYVYRIGAGHSRRSS